MAPLYILYIFILVKHVKPCSVHYLLKRVILVVKFFLL